MYNAILSTRLFDEDDIGGQPRVLMILDVDFSNEPIGSAFVVSIRSPFGVNHNVIIVDVYSLRGGLE